MAFAVQHAGSDHVQPVLVGLDYRHVASHQAYLRLSDVLGFSDRVPAAQVH